MKKNNLLFIFVALISISCSPSYDLTLPKTDVIILNEIGISTSVGGSFCVMNTFIYGLYYNDGINDILFYIGKANDPLKRFKQHLDSFKWKNNRVSCKIQSLKNEGVEINYLIIDEVDINNWMFWERFYISYYKFIGSELKNTTNGGDGGNTDPLNKRRIKIIKAVAKYNLDGVYIEKFDSTVEAARSVNAKPSRIGDCLSSRKDTAKGFQWKYFNGSTDNIEKLPHRDKRPRVLAANKKTSERMRNIPHSQERRDKISNTLTGKFLGKNHVRSIPVIQLDIKTKDPIKYWESAHLASTTLDIRYPNLLQAVKGKRNNAGGFCWAYPSSNEHNPELRGTRYIEKHEEQKEVKRKLGYESKLENYQTVIPTGNDLLAENYQKK